MNSIHVRTMDNVIRRELLYGEGDVLDCGIVHVLMLMIFTAIVKGLHAKD
ncbi:MAG: hypothetical protein WB699_10615 [Bacteroidota bacterium]